MTVSQNVFARAAAALFLCGSAVTLSGCLHSDADGAHLVKQDVEDYYDHQTRNLEYLNKDVQTYVLLQQRLGKELVSDVNDYYAYHNVQLELLKADVKAYERLQLRLAVALKQDVHNYADYQRSLPEEVRKDVALYWANESIKRPTASALDIKN